MIDTASSIPRLRGARVLAVVQEFQDLLVLEIELDGATARAVAYPALTGSIRVGDKLIVNTVACALGLGSGGNHFVIHNWAQDEMDAPAAGHIMKLRYTPLQANVMAIEEPASPYHDALASADSLQGMPVVVATLHSMIAPIAAGLRAVTGAEAKIAYVMTDTAALGMPLSNLVRQMRSAGLLDVTISSGQAFGGEFEAVNPVSALLAARCALQADVAVVAPGIGHVGTGTAFGFSGLEQAFILDAAQALGGRPVAAVRMSQADARPRHQGISHHSLTNLGRICRGRCAVILPEEIPDHLAQLVRDQLASSTILEKHEVVHACGESGLKHMIASGVSPTTMGRTVGQDRLFFLAAAAAGRYAGEVLATIGPAPVGP